MKNKFKLPTVQRLSKALATFAALFTMVMSPVAQGVEAHKFSVKQVQDGLDQMGLNKQITLGEFYKKNKDLIPPRIQKEFETLLVNYKNQLMPQFEVTTSKGTDGLEVPVIRVTQGNELINVQMIGEQDKYAKVQNTYLSEIDITNFDDMLKRIASGDEKYGKQLGLVHSETGASTKPETTDEGMPSLTVAAWNSMSQKDRAGYIINMRQLWNDARRVLIEVDKRDQKAGRKTSLNDSIIEKWDTFFTIFNPDVEAAAKGVVKKAASRDLAPGSVQTVRAGAGSSAFVSGSNCVVAGYISTYTSKKCDADAVLNSYKGKENDIVTIANETCKSNRGANYIACNPLVYGTPEGSPACVDKSSPRFQVATHADGPCEAQSPLGSEIDFLVNKDLKDGNRYEDGNRILKDKELEEKYNAEQATEFQNSDPNNKSKVERFLNGLIAFNGKNANKPGIDFEKPLTEESLRSVLQIKVAFDGEIKMAKASCKAAASNKNNEKNFWGACDQLYRRFLNVAGFLQSTPGCLEASGKKSDTIKIDKDSLRCMCPTGSPALPGTPCGSVQPPTICKEPVVPKIQTKCGGPDTKGPCGPAGVEKPETKQCFPNLQDNNQPAKPIENGNKKECPAVNIISDDCLCPGGGPPTPTVSTEWDGAKVFECVGSTKPIESAPKECGVFCKIGNFIKDYWKPIVGTVVGLYVLKRILTPKKPGIKPAGDICPNGTNAPCPQTCPGAQVPLAAGCGCAPCAPPQTASMPNCVCATNSSTTPKTCPDGVTIVTDLASCPKPSYKCWDGTVVPDVLNCPEKPAAVKAKPTKSTK